MFIRFCPVHCRYFQCHPNSFHCSDSNPDVNAVRKPVRITTGLPYFSAVSVRENIVPIFAVFERNYFATVYLVRCSTALIMNWLLPFCFWETPSKVHEKRFKQRNNHLTLIILSHLFSSTRLALSIRFDKINHISFCSGFQHRNACLMNCQALFIRS